MTTIEGKASLCNEELSSVQKYIAGIIEHLQTRKELSEGEGTIPGFEQTKVCLR